MKDFSMVILAAGRGTRLGGAAPKPLVELSGRPLIEPILRISLALDFKQRVVCISEYTREVRERFSSPLLTYSEDRPMGTGYTALKALEIVTTPYVMIALSDDSFFYTEESIERMCEVHRASSRKATLGVAPLSENLSYAWVESLDGSLISIHKKTSDRAKPPPKDIAAGLYTFDTEWVRSALADVPMGASGEIPLPGVFDVAEEQGLAIGVFSLLPGEWHGVNTPSELASAEKQAKEFTPHIFNKK